MVSYLPPVSRISTSWPLGTLNLILVAMYPIPHHSTDDPTDSSYSALARALYEWAACLVTTHKLLFAKYLARVMQSSSEFITNDEQGEPTTTLFCL